MLIVTLEQKPGTSKFLTNTAAMGAWKVNYRLRRGNHALACKALHVQTLIPATTGSFSSPSTTQRATTNVAEDKNDEMTSEKKGGVDTKRSAQSADVDVRPSGGSRSR